MLASAVDTLADLPAKSVDGVAPFTHMAIDSVGDLTANLRDALVPAADAANATIVPTLDEAALDLPAKVIGAAAPLAHIVDVTLDAAGAAPSVVTGVVGDVATDLPGSLAPLVQTPDTTSQGADPLLDTPSAAIGHLTAPLLDAPGPSTTAVKDSPVGAGADSIDSLDADRVADAGPRAVATIGDSVDGAAAAAAAGLGLADGGTLSFDTDSSPTRDADDLFNDRGYSQYGLALNADVTDRAGRSTDPIAGVHGSPVDQADHDPASDARASRHSNDDATDDTVTAAAAPVLAHATSTLDDLGLRAHDGLL
jgi:hypothetical protein